MGPVFVFKPSAERAGQGRAGQGCSRGRVKQGRIDKNLSNADVNEKNAI
jgi:hypothetical protein